MPGFVFNAQTETETNIKKLHEDWDDLKKTHAVVISTNKIAFNKNLGKVMDNRVTLWKAVHAGQATLDKNDKKQLADFRAKLNALKANGKAGQTIVTAYFTLVKKLNTATSKHAYVPLEQQLVRIDKALKYDMLFADNM